jgi:hypothetical protein
MLTLLGTELIHFFNPFSVYDSLCFSFNNLVFGVRGETAIAALRKSTSGTTGMSYLSLMG